jgi:CheY-like chemotaxis protein
MPGGSYVKLTVRDIGAGMDNDTIEHMYEPFFTTREDGTGLGLATVYGIVKQHDGHIHVVSNPGKGTTFMIYLPRLHERVKEEVAEPDSRDTSRNKETILIVEDEDAVRILAARILERLRYRVILAGDHREALEAVDKHNGPIHLVLTDVIMPGMDGRRLYEQIAAILPEVKVLYMSGYTRNVIAHHGVVSKGIHFLQKPFTIQGLSEKVREVLDD